MIEDILKAVVLILIIILLIITCLYVIYSFVYEIKIDKMITDAANRINNIKEEVDNDIERNKRDL